MKNFLTILLAIVLFSITSCSKDEDFNDPCGYYESKKIYKNLSDSTKLKIPFTGTDTLVYVSNYNDTAILYGVGLNQYTTQKGAQVNSNPDCPKYDYYYIENMDFEFKGNNPNLNYLLFGVNYPDILESREFISTYILNEYNRTRAAVTHYNYLPDYTSPVTIKGKIYYGIDFTKHNPPNFIYNKNYGLILININDTLTYTLNNIKE